MTPGSRADKALTLLVATIGVVCLGYGLWSAWEPLAWVFAGGLCLFVSVGPPSPPPPAVVTK